MIKNVIALAIDYHDHKDAEKLCRQVASLPQGNFKLTVFHVDNGNADVYELSAAERACGVKLLRVEINQGWTGGVNGALAQLKAQGAAVDAYWLLNADIEVEPDCLQKLVDILNREPRAAAVGPNVYKGRTDKIWGTRGVVSPFWGVTAMIPWPQGGVLPKWSYIPGCTVLIRPRAMEQVGGLSPRYRMYYEETHLCIQLQKKGWELWVEPNATAYHMVNSLSAGIPGPYFAFYFSRNNLYFWRENFGIPWPVQLPRALFIIGRELVFPLRKAATFAEFFDRLKYIGAGFIDGFVFLRSRYTPLERKLFKIQENERK